MVGRAAVGAPWLPGAISRGPRGRSDVKEPPMQEQRDAALEHLEWLLETLGSRQGLRHARKHLAAYAEKSVASRALRGELVTTDDPARARALLASSV